MIRLTVVPQTGHFPFANFMPDLVISTVVTGRPESLPAGVVLDRRRRHGLDADVSRRVWCGEWRPPGRPWRTASSRS
jgi:hypothetical protein